MAATWKYLTLSIHYDDKEQKDWILEYKNRPPVIGLQAILETYGDRGWELISLLPVQYHAYPGFGTWTIAPELYRATFKRPTNAGD